MTTVVSLVHRHCKLVYLSERVNSQLYAGRLMSCCTVEKVDN